MRTELSEPKRRLDSPQQSHNIQKLKHLVNHVDEASGKFLPEEDEPVKISPYPYTHLSDVTGGAGVADTLTAGCGETYIKS